MANEMKTQATVEQDAAQPVVDGKKVLLRLRDVKPVSYTHLNVPLYSDEYYDFYSPRVQGWENTATWGWQNAVLDAWVTE